MRQGIIDGKRIKDKIFSTAPMENCAWAAVLVVFLDRFLSKRSLFADGSCMFFRYFYEHSIDNPIAGRYLGGLLLALPLAIAQNFGVQGFDAQFFLWNVSFAFPFLLSVMLIYFLQKEFRLTGFFIICMAATLFYLPNSYFAVGEYNIVYPVLAVLVPSLRQQFRIGDARSAFLSSCCLFVLVLSYEPAAIFAVLVAIAILGIFVWRALTVGGAVRPGLTHLSVGAARAIVWPSFLLLTTVLFSAISIASTPKWAKENAVLALTHYLTDTPRGAVADTWLYFTILVSFLMVWKMNSALTQPQKLPEPQSNKLYKYALWMMIPLAAIAALLTNHLPVHSYYSKTIFIPVFLLLSANLMICSSEQLSRLGARLTPALCLIFLGVTIWLVREGFQFNTFLGRLERDLNALPSQSLVEADRLPIYNTRLGKTYSWSWAQVCLARYLRPSGKSSAFGPFDKEFVWYFPHFQRVVDETMGR